MTPTEKYDLQYFYAVAVDSAKRREGLKEAGDLEKITDAELIKGARDIELISKIGFELLDNIKYMRNWASAAHPNQNQLTGLQLITWLQTCIREVINLPLSNIASNISLLLANIKTKSYLRAEIITMAEFLGNSTSSQLDSLIQGLYGIYLDPTTTPQTSQNINALAPLVWRRVSEETKDRLGVRLAMSIASGNNEHGRKGRSFFEVVGGSQNLPEPLRIGEISDILTNLKNAHRNMNNFYNEPPFAQALERAIGDGRGIPRILERDYVNTIVEVFITNGNGIAYSADAVYERLINLFDERRAIIAIISYSQEAIASKLRFSMCQEKYKQLIGLVIPKITRQAAIDFANHLLSGKVPLEKLSQDSDTKRRLDNLIKLIG